LKKYHIQYIVVKEASVKDYYASYSDLFSAQKAEKFWIIEFQKTGQ